MRQPKSKRVNRDQYDAVLFDLDGVITNTANPHVTCWKEMFDEYLRKRAEQKGGGIPPLCRYGQWIEDAISGVEAGCNGKFGLVIGVARKGNAEELKHHGAQLVFGDLAELID
jgi:beta-phosphoglucomutase-like phosphatase (HAD superfamily)